MFAIFLLLLKMIWWPYGPVRVLSCAANRFSCGFCARELTLHNKIYYPFLKKFDGIIISGQEKIIKPFEGIYLIAINRYELIPSDTIFVDDNLENIKTAIQLGFKTIHLVDPYQIKNEIYKYLN